MKTLVIGSGSWGTALAQTLTDNGQEVLIYGIQADEVNDINNNHHNSRYFDNVELEHTLKATTDLTEGLGMSPDIILLAVPTFAIESTCEKLKGYAETHGTIIVNVSKGLHPVTEERMSQVIKRVCPHSRVVSLIGPSHAEEVILRKLTCICAVSTDPEASVIVQNMFSNEHFRVYTGADETGSELGVAIKNVMAIASGISSGLGYGDNTRAALITRGLHEMARFIKANQGNPDTLMGLTGVGDLIVTCSSIHSRNYQAGYAIGQQDNASEFLATNKKTVEGIKTADMVHRIAMKQGLEMPICTEVYKVLYEGKKPSESIKDLMLRDLKEEHAE